MIVPCVTPSSRRPLPWRSKSREYEVFFILRHRSLLYKSLLGVVTRKQGGAIAMISSDVIAHVTLSRTLHLLAKLA